MKPYVLVHGAWHGGWCWKKTAPLLRDAGAEVFAPTLTGMGERAHLNDRLDPAQITLDVHIQDIVQLMRYEGLEDVVLVGHAYAGMVITGVAEVCPERIAHMVYVNGVIPADGESMADQLIAVRGEEFAAWVRDQIENGDGFLPAPASAEEVGRRWGITDPEDLAWVGANVTPQPAAAMASPVRMGNPKAAEIPKNFVGGGESGFDSVSERARQAGWGIYPVDSGHDTMITHAPELADILLEIGSE
ncbi:MAG: alpha/beta hydrolase [Chloroflexi bacterium]|jgi:pimeloyl-ACP methyl ester carboxylesterase|nr:alpha/beta fold hydrolase [Dehalococcoidia bacterium]PCJ73721.1 MAG: alpha/beta hydrolase [Dehalococcoidia bacterium]RUA20777.1 MAG: alpha/beta hydrolase [Chloroflexota bacterium]RUA28657.1 MAG: alpha/beta hydrolase [Chloroflexota bacterium]